MSRDELDPLLQRALDELPDELAPDRDLWPDIRRRLEPEPAAQVPQRRRSWRVPVAIAAAAVLGFGAGALWDAPPAPAPAPAVAVAELPEPPSWEAGMRSAAAELEARITDRPLDPEAEASIRESLRQIDAAIEAIHAELREDPDNAELDAHLVRVWEHKISILSAAAHVPTARG